METIEFVKKNRGKTFLLTDKRMFDNPARVIGYKMGLVVVELLEPHLYAWSKKQSKFGYEFAVDLSTVADGDVIYLAAVRELSPKPEDRKAELGVFAKDYAGETFLASHAFLENEVVRVVGYSDCSIIVELSDDSSYGWNKSGLCDSDCLVVEEDSIQDGRVLSYLSKASLRPILK